MLSTFAWLWYFDERQIGLSEELAAFQKEGEEEQWDLLGKLCSVTNLVIAGSVKSSFLMKSPEPYGKGS